MKSFMTLISCILLLFGGAFSFLYSEENIEELQMKARETYREYRMARSGKTKEQKYREYQEICMELARLGAEIPSSESESGNTSTDMNRSNKEEKEDYKALYKRYLEAPSGSKMKERYFQEYLEAYRRAEESGNLEPPSSSSVEKGAAISSEVRSPGAGEALKVAGPVSGDGWNADTPMRPVNPPYGSARSGGPRGFFKKLIHGVERGTEQALGLQVASSLELVHGVNKNPTYDERLQRVGARIAAVSDRQDLKYKFRVLNMDEVNAFAVPGGYIYVTRGMMEFLKSDSELAGVLGHEMAHQTCRHSIRALERTALVNTLISRSKAGVVQDNKTALQIANLFVNLRFSREDEFEADRVGLGYMQAAGYDARAMVNFFERLGQKYGMRVPTILQYFQSHPSTEERIKRIREAAGIMN